jgi:hypothetical protein
VYNIVTEFGISLELLWLSLSYFATDSQSVSQSILALSPSGTHDQVLPVIRQLLDWRNGASSLTGRRVCLVTGHSLCVGNMYVIILQDFFVVYRICDIFLLLNLLALQSRFRINRLCWSSYKPPSRQLTDRMPDCHQVWVFITFYDVSRLGQ